MNVGATVKELRSSLGWSQGRLADALTEASGYNMTREYVSKWERGRITPGPFWLRHLASVLQVPHAVLEGSDVDRRQFLTDFAATTVAPVVAADLIMGGFSAALGGTEPPADLWFARLDAYGRDYMSRGAAEIQQRLTGDLVVLQQQLDQPGLWSVAAKLMTLYGKTFPGSDGAKAASWYRMAAKAADRSGDQNARVWVRGRAAIALGYEGASLGLADAFAQHAIAISDAPSLGRLNAVMGRAHVAAVRGDRPGALALLNEGRRIFEAAGSHEQTSDYSVPEWRMQVFTSLLLARLGEERGALEAQDQAVGMLPASLPRFRTHIQMHRGLMLTRAGDHTGGVAFAREALDALPPEKHSLTLRMLMAELADGARGCPAPRPRETPSA
ncbi:MAG: helix-turn-helix domain-containing protein [Carbonactinosporaceae bacterium]